MNHQFHVHEHGRHLESSHDYPHRHYQPHDNAAALGSHQHHHYYEQPHVHQPIDHSEHSLGLPHPQSRHGEGSCHHCEGHHYDNQVERNDNVPMNLPPGIFDSNFFKDFHFKNVGYSPFRDNAS